MSARFDLAIEKFMEDQEKEVTGIVCKNGELAEPLLRILSYHRFTDTVHHINIPAGMAFQSESHKEFFASHVLPTLFNFHALSGRRVLCVAIISEAWLRVFNKDELIDGKMPPGYRDRPTQDTLTFMFETADFARSKSFLIEKDGRSATLSLSSAMDSRDPNCELGGRFLETFRKYNAMYHY